MTKEDRTMQTITYERTPKQPAPEHEYAKLFPLLDGEARQRLVDDIRANGVLEPIVFLDGYILDGRNRYYAARELLIEYPRVDYDGDDPLAFVISRNMHRRHLTESQRAAAAAKIAKLPPHRPEKGANLHPSVEQAADMMNVSERSVQTAKKVIERGAPQLVAAVDAGKVSVSAAAKVAELPPDEQEDIVAHGKDAILEAAKRIKEQERQERLARQRENDAAREETAAQFSQDVQAARARTEEYRAQAKAAKAKPSGDVEALRAEIEEKDEYIASLEAENADLKRRIAKFDDMVVQYEKGGFEAVLAAKDEAIRVLETRLYAESADKASWMKLAKRKDKSIAFYKAEAEKRGYTDPKTNKASTEAEEAEDEFTIF